MAFIPTANCVQARIMWAQGDGTVAENVLYFATTSVPTSDDLDEIGLLLHDWLEESLMPGVVNTWQVTGINLRAMNEEEGLATFYSTGFPLTGGDTGAPAANQVCYTVTLSTGLVGRSARGRVYVLGITNTVIVGGKRLSDAAQAAFDGRWHGLLTASDTAGHAWQVVSFVDGGVPRTAGRMLPVLATTVRFPLATQRRRLS